MGTFFNADEALQMAAKIEANGGAFYRRAAEFCADSKDLLLEIAEQEDKHLALFEKMRANLASSEGGETDYGPNEEASLYLKAMADGHVFDLDGDGPETSLQGNESIDDIIKIAIQAEKDSIAFFVGMKECVPVHLGKDKIDALILEETKHIYWLINRKVT